MPGYPTLPGAGTNEGYDPESGKTPRTPVTWIPIATGDQKRLLLDSVSPSIAATASGESSSLSVQASDALPLVLGAGAIAFLGYLIVKGLTAPRPTLRSGYRRIGGRLYQQVREYTTKSEAQKLARVERDRGYLARILQDKSSRRWQVWRSVRQTT